jgi:glucokinase
MRKGLRLGVDLGGTRVKLGLVDERGRVLDRRAVDTVADPRALARAVWVAARPWMERGVRGTGVGVAGDVDAARGVVRLAPNLGWRGVSVARHFRAAGWTGPLCFENDATAAAWGAYHMELHRRVGSLVLIALGTGVGGGLVFNGALYRGATGSAGEIGHLVVDPKGPRCGCGGRGCLETYLGAVGLSAEAARRDAARGRKKTDVTPLDLARRARRGDPVARAVWDRAGRALGAALANLVNTLNPEVILFTGGVARAAPLFLPTARRVLRATAFPAPARAACFRVSRHPESLGLVGAALLVE